MLGTVLARTRLIRLLPVRALARLVAMRLSSTGRPAMLWTRVMARWPTSLRRLVSPVMLGCPVSVRPPVTPWTLATPQGWRSIWSALPAAGA